MWSFPSAACLGPNPDTLEKRNKGSWLEKKQRRTDYDSCQMQASIMITCALVLPYPVWHGMFLHQAASCPHIPHAVLCNYCRNLKPHVTFKGGKIQKRPFDWVEFVKDSIVSKELYISLKILLYIVYNTKIPEPRDMIVWLILIWINWFLFLFNEIVKKKKKWHWNYTAYPVVH